MMATVIDVSIHKGQRSICINDGNLPGILMVQMRPTLKIRTMEVVVSASFG